MLVCKLCKKPFKTTAIINGKRKNLNRRKYCLICSPWGEKNTSKLEFMRDGKIVKCAAPERVLDYFTRLCNRCGKEYKRSDNKGNTKEYCSGCYINKRRVDFKQRTVEYKGGSCIICGYSKSLRSLTFHHRDPAQKYFQISGMYHMNWETVKLELDKCDLICHNCHGELHEDFELQKFGHLVHR